MSQQQLTDTNIVPTANDAAQTNPPQQVDHPSAGHTQMNSDDDTTNNDKEMQDIAPAPEQDNTKVSASSSAENHSSLSSLAIVYPPSASTLMTVTQAKALNSKLKGYKWVVSSFSYSNNIAATVHSNLEAKRQRKVKDLTEPGEKEISAKPTTPNTNLNKARPLKKAKTSHSPIIPSSNHVSNDIEDEIRRKEEQMKELQHRLAKLKNQQQQLTTTATPPPHISLPAETLSSANTKPRKSLTKTVKAPAAKPKVPEFNDFALTVSSPSISTSRGRTVKPPAQYAVEIPLTGELKRCKLLLDTLLSTRDAQGLFNIPVNYTDPDKPFYAPNYLEIIKAEPMDLGTIKSKLLNGEYGGLEDFSSDLRLVWSNAMAYNPPENWIHSVANKLSQTTENEINKLLAYRERAAQEKKQTKKSSESAAGGVAGSPAAASAAGDAVDYMQVMRSQIDSVLDEKIAQFGLNRPSTSNPAAVRSRDKTPLSQREKQLLKDDIFKLPANKLGQLIATMIQPSSAVISPY
jgi:hypothetical protein